MVGAFGQRESFAEYYPVRIPASYREYAKQEDAYLRRLLSDVRMAGSSLTSEYQARMKKQREFEAIKRILAEAGIR